MVSRGRTEKGKDWGVLVEFADLDGKPHRVPIPMTLLGGDAREALDMLTSAGLHLAGADKLIRASVIDLITKWVPDTRITVANKMGWVDGHKAFVLGNGTTIGDPVLCVSAGGGGHAQCARHAAARHGRRLARQRRRAVRRQSGDDGGGVGRLCRTAARHRRRRRRRVHLRGGSSSGKTTALKAAASVWGDPDAMTMTWRATSNGIEAIAAAANSTLLVLDEHRHGQGQRGRADRLHDRQRPGQEPRRPHGRRARGAAPGGRCSCRRASRTSKAR